YVLGNENIKKRWNDFIEKNNIPYGEKLDREKTVIWANEDKKEEDELNILPDYEITSLNAMYKRLEEIINTTKELMGIDMSGKYDIAFIKYLDPLYSFKGKSFPDIDELPVEIFNLVTYRKWFERKGKKFPKELNPFVLVYLEREGEEERMDVIYWIEPTEIVKKDNDLKEMRIRLPVLSVIIKPNKKYLLINTLRLEYYNYTREFYDNQMYDKFVAELVGKE
ncbi:MAG: hypothetical protein GXN99_01290, partial [Candidatus Nanohaloarchaeota archaeon]|nr:hypothetical protein [Candidatus Nanohaloarchaeota archaeon]